MVYIFSPFLLFFPFKYPLLMLNTASFSPAFFHDRNSSLSTLILDAYLLVLLEGILSFLFAWYVELGSFIEKG